MHYRIPKLENKPKSFLAEIKIQHRILYSKRTSEDRKKDAILLNALLLLAEGHSLTLKQVNIKQNID